MKAVIPCNLLNQEIVEQEWREEIQHLDLILSSLTLTCLADNVEQYEGLIQKCASYLKPKGGLILVQDLHSAYYEIGSTKFSHFYLSEDVMTSTLVKNGFSIVKQNVFDYKANGIDTDELAGSASCMFIFAIKQ